MQLNSSVTPPLGEQLGVCPDGVSYNVVCYTVEITLNARGWAPAGHEATLRQLCPKSG